MSNRRKKATGDDEVEQLLRAAQDDVLLKLSLNSHLARAASSAAIDSDLDRRFQDLKKPQKLTNHDESVKKAPKKPDAGGCKSAGEPTADDDLFSRFAALKNVLPSNSSNFPRDGSVDQQATDEEEEDEEDEVEKVINWAIDAARLDPSPISDDDGHDNESDYSSDDDGDGDGVGKGKKSKEKMMELAKGRRAKKK